MFGVLTTHIANNILIKVVPYIYMSTQTSQSINEKRTVHSKDSTDDMDLFFFALFSSFLSTSSNADTKREQNKMK